MYGVLDLSVVAAAVLLAHALEAGDLSHCGLRDPCVRARTGGGAGWSMRISRRERSERRGMRSL